MERRRRVGVERRTIGQRQRLSAGRVPRPNAGAGEARGNVVVQDRVIRPAQAFTPAGLYAGYFLEGRAEDGLPDVVSLDSLDNSLSLLSRSVGVLIPYDRTVFGATWGAATPTRTRSRSRG